MGGVLAILAGLLTFFGGLAAVVRSHFYPTLGGYAYRLNVHTWGWILLALGAVMFAVGACALLGMAWARAAGVGLAVLTAIGSFLFLPYSAGMGHDPAPGERRRHLGSAPRVRSPGILTARVSRQPRLAKTQGSPRPEGRGLPLLRLSVAAPCGKSGRDRRVLAGDDAQHRVDKRQVGECLREVAHVLAAVHLDLLGVQLQRAGQ